MTSILRAPNIADERLTLRGTRRNSTAVPIVSAAPASNGQEIADRHDSAHADMPSVSQKESYQAGYHEGHVEGTAVGHEEGYQIGYENGMQTGDAEGREAYGSGLRQLEELAQNLNRSVERGLEESEDMMVAIVFESVCKIVGDTLATKEGVAAVVREALGRIRGKSALIIRVNPVDLELIEESAAFGVASEADWRADDTVPMGGCLIESEYGTLDARIDTQLNQLKRVLLATRHRATDQSKGE